MITLKSIDASGVKDLYARMARDFPSSERPPRNGVWLNLKRGVYSAYYFIEEEEVNGYAVVSEGKGDGFVLLSFFAVEPSLRGLGFGGKFLETLFERYKGIDILIEIEDPDKAESEAEREARLGRARFYLKAGFRYEPVSRCRIFGVDMLIMRRGEREMKSVKEALHGIYLRQFLIEAALRNIVILD
jgi:GNAT superfamily N-acetyltransferase